MQEHFGHRGAIFKGAVAYSFYSFGDTGAGGGCYIGGYRVVLDDCGQCRAAFKGIVANGFRGVGQYDFLYLCAACKACHVGYAADAGQVDGGDILSLGFFQESGQGGDVVGVYRARHGQFGLSLGRGYIVQGVSQTPRRSGWQADGFAER